MRAEHLAYALFALQQPLDLDELRAGAREGRLPMADAAAPDWFAAAATAGATLLDMAPELRLPVTEEAVPEEPVDLVRLYGPEHGAPTGAAATRPAVQAEPGGPVNIDLLRELADLDEE